MKKVKLRKDEYEFLKAYKDNLYTAYYSDYSRALGGRDLKPMAEIYSRLGGGSININCSKCVLKLLKNLYPYFEEKEKELEKVQKELEPIESTAPDEESVNTATNDES